MRHLAAAIIAIVVSTASFSGAFAAEPFTFYNQSSFVDETKIMHVFGEIKNESDAAMKDVIITASFYDKDGNMLGELRRSPELRVINLGESSPFEIQYLDARTVGDIKDFTLSATGVQTEPKEKNLKIVSSNSRLDLLGTYYINVVAGNEGSETATNSIVIATLYDKDGRVIAIGKALAEAGAGSSHIPPGTEAAFGIAVTEKTQTYKATKYSLAADSDQYTSKVLSFQATGPGSSSNQTRSGCLIATAAFGSELASQVQELRTFRDEVTLHTFAGSSFMQVFNAWYYSFSPSVAEYERNAPWLQSAVRVAIYPLLWVLDASTSVYNLFAFNNEIAITMAGVTASSLVGALYLAPLAAGLGAISRRKRWNVSKAGYTLVSVWMVSLAAVAVAEFVALPEIMMLGTSLLVLSAISTVILAVVHAVRR